VAITTGVISRLVSSTLTIKAQKMGKAIMTKSKSGQRIKINSWKVNAEKQG